MTLSKPGYNRSRGDSANASLREDTPKMQNGPEEHSADASSSESEDEQNTTSQYRYATGSSAAHRGTTAESSRRVKNCKKVSAAQFGSPFTYKPYQNKEDFFMGLLHQSTCDLFDQVVAEAKDLRERLSMVFSLSDNGDDPNPCWLKRRGSSSNDTDVDEESDTSESKLEIQIYPSDVDTWLLDPDMGIEVLCDRKSKPGEIQYFVVNNGRDKIHVNRRCVKNSRTAGPLPDFTVFRTAQYSCFWWRTAAALDYKPAVTRKRRFEDDDGESPRKALKSDKLCPYKPEPPPIPQVFPDSKNWLDEYHRRYNICEGRPMKFPSSITDVQPPSQHLPGDMHSIDVILAIGAVWLGLIEAKIDFAYADSDLFSFARSMRKVGMHAVKGTNHFLMPLLFDEESLEMSPEPQEHTAEPLEPVFSAFQRGEQQRHQEHSATAEQRRKKIPGTKSRSPTSLEDQNIQKKAHKGGNGHFMLAIAERVCTDSVNSDQGAQAKKDLVRLRFMDSSDGAVDKGLIRRVARNTVRHAGWLGDIWPCFDASEEDWAHVIQQTGNRSGEHTVLNAWAYMLNIPLATARAKKFGPSSYKEVRKMMRLALRGQLDSLTIRAWMQHSKYAVDQPLSQLRQIQVQQPSSPNNLRNMQTVALNQEALSRIVEEFYEQEQAEKQKHAEKQKTTPAPTQDSTASSSSICLSVNPSASPRTWQRSLDQGLASNITEKDNTHRTTKSARKNASIIPKYSNLASEQVIIGIAPIWEGIKRLHRPDLDFAYAGVDVLAPGGQERQIGTVGEWRRFIMPLFFSDVGATEIENQAKLNKTINTVGHLLLCVAELVYVAEESERPAMTVQLEILDSRPGTVSEDNILLEAQSRIKDSRWLGRKGHQGPIKYKMIFRDVPQQVGYNTCGLFTILNAWAYMLNIPIHTGPVRRGRDPETLDDATDTEFLRLGLEIVNLALKGFMDSATIQAFFHKYGYSVEQRCGDPTRAAVKVYAIGMNHDKLERTLRRWKMFERITSARAKGKTFREEHIGHLMTELNISEEDAWTALVMGKGRVDDAMAWTLAWGASGQLEPPAEALSPQTPEKRRHFDQPPPPPQKESPSQAPDPSDGP